MNDPTPGSPDRHGDPLEQQLTHSLRAVAATAVADREPPALPPSRSLVSVHDSPVVVRRDRSAIRILAVAASIAVVAAVAAAGVATQLGGDGQQVSAAGEGEAPAVEQAATPTGPEPLIDASDVPDSGTLLAATPGPEGGDELWAVSGEDGTGCALLVRVHDGIRSAWTSDCALPLTCVDPAWDDFVADGRWPGTDPCGSALRHALPHAEAAGGANGAADGGFVIGSFAPADPTDPQGASGPDRLFGTFSGDAASWELVVDGQLVQGPLPLLEHPTDPAVRYFLVSTPVVRDGLPDDGVHTIQLVVRDRNGEELVQTFTD